MKNTSLTIRKVFTWALGVYFLAWLGVCAFAYEVFGGVLAIGLSLISGIPLVVGVRMRGRWQSLRPREFAFLFTLAVVALAGSGGLIQNWYATGMDRCHAEDVECAEFARLLREDPAFRNVKIVVSRKHTFWMRGTVASQADLDRLELLAAQYPVACGKDGVTIAPQATEQVPSRSSGEAKTAGDVPRGG